MNFLKDYQDFCESTAIYKQGVEAYVQSLGIPDKEKETNLIEFLNLTYSILGLVNEAGEVAGKLKKIVRDNNCVLGMPEKENLAAELGDVNWYNARVASELGLDLKLIISENQIKLTSRQERGMLKGSGDKR